MPAGVSNREVVQTPRGVWLYAPTFCRGRGGRVPAYLSGRPTDSLTHHVSLPASTLKSPQHGMENTFQKIGSSTTHHAADFAISNQLMTKSAATRNNHPAPTTVPTHPPTSTSQSLHVMEIERRRPSKSWSSTTSPVQICKTIIDQCHGACK